MQPWLLMLLHLTSSVGSLLKPGGAKALVAENFLLRHQLLILRRARQRAPNLRFSDRLLFGFGSLFLRPRRLLRTAILVKPSTLVRCHRALAELKLEGHWALIVMDVFTRRIIGFGVQAVAVDGPALCRLFNRAIAGQTIPKRLSYDHDPLFAFQRWQANLRILGIDSVRSVPYVPISHPFVERLIGTVRREYLDRMLFWNEVDLEQKLDQFKKYYNEFRVHQSLEGMTPTEKGGRPPPQAIHLSHYGWQAHCHVLFELPAAA